MTNPSEAIIGDIPDRAQRGEIVRLMTERFMLHCTDDNDRHALYALALLRHPDATLLIDKAIALLGLGRVQEVIDAVQEALRRLLPGDRLEEYINHLELLTASPEPLEGLDKVLSPLREAVGWRGSDFKRTCVLKNWLANHQPFRRGEVIPRC